MMHASSLPPLLPSPPFVLHKIDFQTYQEVIGQLRVAAWRDEHGVQPAFFARSQWIEALDAAAHHWVIMDGDKVVASARLSLHQGLEGVPHADLLPAHLHHSLQDQLIGDFSRLVVAPTHRRHSFSGVLDRARMAQGLADGAQLLMSGVHLSFRQQSLRRLGFDTLYTVPYLPDLLAAPVHFMVYHAGQ